MITDYRFLPDYGLRFSKDYRLREKIGLHDYGLQCFAGLRITIFPKITDYEKIRITVFAGLRITVFPRITDYGFLSDYGLR